jgi:hypothetical protein
MNATAFRREREKKLFISDNKISVLVAAINALESTAGAIRGLKLMLAEETARRNVLLRKKL